MGSQGDFVRHMEVYRAVKQAKWNQDWCYGNFINYRSMMQVQKVRKQLRELCTRYKLDVKSKSRDMEALRRCVAAGMFFNAAEYCNDGSYRVLHSGQSVQIHPSSCLFKSKPGYVVFSEIVQTSASYMRTVCVVDPQWLHDSAPGYFRSKLKLLD